MDLGDYLKMQNDANKYRAFVDPSGQPQMPGYSGWTGADGNLLDGYALEKAGALTPELQAMLAGINPDMRGIEALRNRALGTGPSTWAQLMLEKEGVERGERLDKTVNNANAARATAMRSLATQGGARGAARERLAGKASLAEMFGRQDVERQGQVDRTNIGIQDETQKLDLLKGLPAAEVAMLQPALQKAGLWANMATNDRDYASKVDSFNIQNKIGDVKGKQDYNMGKYSEQMKAWAANRTAEAQENSGKK